jgi:hypothetical protein
LREGAEPIPDASWITPARDSFALPAGKDGGADFYVSIPNDKSLLGRKFQVNFVAQTAGEGQFVQLGMGGRAFLTVYDKPVEWSNQEKKDKMFGVQFRPDPRGLRADNVPLGRKTPFKKLSGTRWLVRNDGDYPAKVSVRVAAYEETETVLPAGCEPGPDPEKVLKLSTRKIVIPPHGAKEIKGSILLPDVGGYKNKKYMYFIAVENQDKRAPVTKYGGLFVHTRP